MSQKLLSATEPELEREEPSLGSDRSFGLVLSVALAIIGLWPLLDGHAPRYWSVVPACIFLLLAVLAPQSLRGLKILWSRFSALLQSIVSPVVMGAVFFLVMTPLACTMRVLGKDPLRLTWDKNAKSYWIERQPAGPEPQTMTRQF